ncbi:MAG: DUF4212 domain-containing protein [Deltaproteobacteria bacterium]|nr:DUF4212 domain-containing protein [Deltaproteobacteria bacterium]
MADSKEYEINFFTPKSPFAKDNTKIIAWIVIIWALAVFGFHFLMKAIEKPTPEPAYITYESVWENVKSNTATDIEKKDLAKVYLTLLGKYIELRDNPVLKKALTSTIYDILPAEEKMAFVEATQVLSGNLDDFELLLNAVKKFPEGIKQNIIDALGLSNDNGFNNLLANVIPYGLLPFDGAPLDKENMDTIPVLMDKYLIHFQSGLTDTKFLGFPFHYFYTSVFLLVLFCGLCWYYCVAIDKIMDKHGMEKGEV